MINYPDINPVILPIWGPFQLRWYGLMYIVAFIGCWILLKLRSNHSNSNSNSNSSSNLKSYLSDLIFTGALGIILGGRIGYCLFYNFSKVLADPLWVFKLWEGGMSFHGGLIGAIVAIILFARKNKLSILEIGDYVAPVVPFGLACGRLANFINGELWGKITLLPWGMVYPQAGPYPRHPYPIYAILFEGFFLMALLYFYARKSRQSGAVSGMFLISYGIIRFLEEFVRIPDSQLGYLAFDWLTMGQVLSIPMIIIGFILLKGYHATIFKIDASCPRNGRS